MINRFSLPKRGTGQLVVSACQENVPAHVHQSAGCGRVLPNEDVGGLLRRRHEAVLDEKTKEAFLVSKQTATKRAAWQVRKRMVCLEVRSYTGARG